MHRQGHTSGMGITTPSALQDSMAFSLLTKGLVPLSQPTMGSSPSPSTTGGRRTSMIKPMAWTTTKTGHGWVHHNLSSSKATQSHVRNTSPVHLLSSNATRTRYSHSARHKVGSGAGKLIWNVLPGKTYLVRIASVTSSAFLNFVIEGHTMTVIEADGHMIQPFNTTSIDILSGQTYAFNFTTKGPEYPDQRVYHIGVNARDGIADSKNASGTDPGLAVLSYNFPNINQTVTPSTTDATTLWDSTDPPTRRT
jgi:hypothetical protein